MTAAVDNDDAVARGEDRDLVAPIARMAELAMQQDNGLTLTELRVPDAHAVDRLIAAVDCLLQDPGRRQRHLLLGGACRTGGTEKAQQAHQQDGTAHVTSSQSA
jgi:hypothetical protein